MLSSVFFAGRIDVFDEKYPDIRYVIIKQMVPDDNGKFPHFKVPVQITRSCCRLANEKEGKGIIVKGRLGYKEGFGLVLVHELEETY